MLFNESQKCLYPILIDRPSIRKKVDYLTYCWRPKLGSVFDELYHIIKYGFRDPIEYKVTFFFKCYH